MLDIILLLFSYSLSSLSTSLSSLTGRPVWADLTGLPVHPGSDLIRPVGPQDPDWSIEEAGG